MEMYLSYLAFSKKSEIKQTKKLPNFSLIVALPPY